MLQTLYTTHKDDLSSYKSPETSGASLNEALDRYKKYERKLVDTLRPTEETLRRFSQNPNFYHNQTASASAHHHSSKLNMFPHGGK